MSNDESFDARLDAYLDGTLSGPARLRVEAEQAETLALQREVDADLARAFAMPEGLDERLAVALHEAPSSTRSGQTRAALAGPRWTPLLQAAAALAVAVGLWSLGSEGAGPTTLPAAGLIPMNADGLYAAMVDASRTTSGDCNADGGFGTVLSELYGHPVSMAPGLLLSGPFRCEMWPTATVLTTVVPFSEPAVILIDLLERDPGFVVGPASPLTVHRREEGPLVIYELTPGSTSCLPTSGLVVEEAAPADR